MAGEVLDGEEEVQLVLMDFVMAGGWGGMIHYLSSYLSMPNRDERTRSHAVAATAGLPRPGGGRHGQRAAGGRGLVPALRSRRRAAQAAADERAEGLAQGPALHPAGPLPAAVTTYPLLLLSSSLLVAYFVSS